MLETTSTVILTDPDVQQSRRVAVFLESCGYRVRLASDEQQALAFINPNTSCVVLAELNLGDKTGFDLLSSVLKLSVHVPFIFFTAEDRARDVVEALRVGATDYILKPLDDLNLLDVVIQKALHIGELENRNEENQRQLLKMNRELNLSVKELQRDQAAGRLVQQKLSPETPRQLGGVNIDYQIFPSLYLSGDAIDFGLLEQRYLAFYLTDISGHGSASAFVAVWVKQLVRSFFRGHTEQSSGTGFAIDIPSLMQRINYELLKANVGSHLTCFVGVIDTQTLDLHYVIGGHLPLPILVSDGQVSSLDGFGKPLGLFEDADWQVNTVRLPQSFSLFVFSDGILEVIDRPGLLEKEAFLVDLFKNLDSLDIKGIETALKLEHINTVPDDVAMLSIRR